jgi:HK97 family phage prohead protease
MKPSNYEERCVPGIVEIRERANGGSVIRGLAAVYNKLSDNLGGFREVIAPGAFEDTDMSDVRGLFNHDSNFVLGRSKSETLRLNRVREGLEYEIDMPDTQTIRDLVVEPIRRGDVDQSSFGFIVGGGNDSWDENEDGVLIRTIHKIRELFDVSPVTFPAYPDTTVGARARDKFLEERERIADEGRKAIDDRNKRAAFLDRLTARSQLPRGR